jgi:hypothetical protein
MRRHAATILVLALLGGTAVAFAETERLKLEPTPIQESFVQPAFSPICTCAKAKAAIRLRLHRADTVTVRILDSSGHAIRVLLDGKRLPSGRTQLEWDGRDDSGMRVADGRYKVDVRLARAHRTFTLPRTVTLDTIPPTVRRVSYRRKGDRLRVYYRLSEAAHGVLFVNGRRTVITYTSHPTAKLPWTIGPRRLYRLQVAAVDLAGNLGARTRVAVLRTR